MADSVLRLGSMVDTMWRLVRPSAERHPPEFSKQARIWVVLFNQFLVTLYAPPRRTHCSATELKHGVTGMH